MTPHGVTAPDPRPRRLRPLDVGRLGLLGIRTRKVRAVLSALGISIGIATIVIVTGVPASSHAALQAQLTALGTNVLQAQPVPTDQQPIELPTDSVARVQRIGPVTQAAAVADIHAVVQRTSRAVDGSGIAVLAASLGLPSALNGQVVSGRFLTNVTQNFPDVVLGHVAAGWLGIATVDPNRARPLVWIGDKWFAVVGILGPLPLVPSIDRSVVVGWGIAGRYFDFDGHPTSVYVHADESAIGDVTSVLPATLYPQIPGLINVTQVSDVLAAKRAADHNFSSLYLGLAAVALLVGGIGVANTMVISVLERRREIGLRRALGATRGQVRSQFLTEAVLLASLGGTTGTILGGLSTIAYAEYQNWPIVIPLSAVIGGTAGAVIVGVLAGLYPSIRAARLTPTQALAGT